MLGAQTKRPAKAGLFASQPKLLHALLHVFDHDVAEARARHLGRAFHQAGEVVGHLLRRDRLFHRGNDQVSRFDPAHVAQHHFSRQDERTGVHVVLARVLRRRAVGGFEHRHRVAEIGAGGDADAADLRGQRVGYVVTVQVQRGDHAVLGRAQKEFAAELIDGGPWMKIKNPKTGGDIVVKDVIADAFLQQILLRPAEYDVIATLNLNGDYISDALAAQVGGIGIAPGANMSDSVAMFEATHGTAPKYAGKDYVNPGSEILSAEMMLRHMGWTEAADLIIKSMEKSILQKRVTYDFARLIEGATQVSCSGFGQVLIENM